MGSDYSANACIDAGVRAANQCCQPTTSNTTNDIVEFDEDSVIIYDIVGCRVHSDTRPRSRYVFLLPGRLIHSSKTKNVKIGFTAAIEDYSQRGGGLDISYRTQIELLDSKCLRVWNRIEHEDDKDDDDFTSPRNNSSKKTSVIDDFGCESPGTSSKRSPSNRSMITTTESLDLVGGSEDEYNAYSDEDVFKGIRRKELPSCIIMKFQTEDDMSPWVTLLEIEKKKINFPRHLFDPPVDEVLVPNLSLVFPYHYYFHLTPPLTILTLSHTFSRIPFRTLPITPHDDSTLSPLLSYTIDLSFPLYYPLMPTHFLTLLLPLV